MTFIEMLRNRWQKANSMGCVGLDSDKTQVPEVAGGIGPFNKSIISMTRDFVCAYKPNIAFYEDQWVEGLRVLKETFAFSREVAPDIPIILDAKRTDIGNTNKGYVRMAFDELKADAITVNPYFGGEALQPFFGQKDKGIIVMCRTSNPGAKEFQDLKTPVVELPEKARKFFMDLYGETGPEVSSRILIPMYEYVAWRAAYEWNANGNVLLVVGATYPEELAKVRKIVGDMPILVPGIGAQAGDLEGTVKAGLDSTGFGMIINSARGIIFASKAGDFAEVAGREAEKLRDQINEVKVGIKVEKIFAQTKAIIKNSHVVYTSGKHGSEYVNKDAVYRDTEATDEVCREIAEHFKSSNVEVVVAPVEGGINLSQGVARHLTKLTGRKVISIFADKEGEGLTLKRGYDKDVPDKKVLVVDDVFTTGGSVKKLIELVRTLNGEVVAVGGLCNRGGVKVTDLGEGISELFTLTSVQMAAYDEAECPLCKGGVPISTEVGKGKEYLAKKAK